MTLDDQNQEKSILRLKKKTEIGGGLKEKGHLGVNAW